MRTDLTPAEIVHWLRMQARKFDTMADEIEQAFAGFPPSSPTTAGTSQGSYATTTTTLPSVTVDDVRQVMGDKAMRKATIASHLDVPEYALDEVLTEDNGFLKRRRGWFIYDPESTNDQDNGQVEEEDLSSF